MSCNNDLRYEFGPFQLDILLVKQAGVAERCGDQEGAGRALLTMFEEINDGLELNEKTEISEKIKRVLGRTQQSSLDSRVEKCLALVESTSHKIYD
ncbi:MAG TPA: hypothetical protein VHS05_24270 [Pyrinomonadaceae bacterium]|jgi:hypothetical protein|nr:hypothetical protein [Pyrinomonadaceae bacterium]